MPDLTSMFNLPASYNRLTDFFPQEQESPVESAYRAKAEGGYPARPPKGAPDVQSLAKFAALGLDPMAILDLSQKLKANTQADELIKGLSGLDPRATDYSQRVGGLIGKNPLGARDPSVDRVLNLHAFSQRQRQDSKYDDETASAIRDLSVADYSTPEGVKAANDRIAKLSPGAVSSPRMATWLEHHQNNVANHQLRQEQIKAKTKDVAVQLRGAGMSKAQVDALRDKDGFISDEDAAEAVFHAKKNAKIEGRPLPEGLTKSLGNMFTMEGKLTPVSDEDKIRAYQEAGFNPDDLAKGAKNPAAWDKAYWAERASRIQKEIDQHADSGFEMTPYQNRLNEFRQRHGLVVQSAPQVPGTAGPVMQNAPQPAAPIDSSNLTREQVMALPPGTAINVNGTVKYKR